MPTEKGDVKFPRVTGMTRSKSDKEFFYFLYDKNNNKNYKIGLLERELGSKTWKIIN